MKKRSLSGNVAVAVFCLAAVLFMMSFFSHNWLVSDERIPGAKFDKLGLWHHCFHSIEDVNDPDQRRHFTGCHWIFDPFTTGYNEMRDYLVPTFMVFVLIFYVLAFLIVLAACVGAIVFFTCFTPDDHRFIPLTFGLGWSLVGAGSITVVAVFIFGLFANRDNWMPGHENNFFGWSFGVAICSTFALITSGILFLVEHNIQTRKRRQQIKDSQSRFDMEESKA